MFERTKHKPIPSASEEAGYRIGDYSPIEELLPGLWRVVGSMPVPMKRVMYIYRLPDGGLLLDSVVAMHEPDLLALERLGTPRVMVLPHPKHWWDARFYKQRWPKLEVLGEPDVRAKVEGLEFDGTLVERLPAFGVTPHPVPGMKMHEVVLELPIPARPFGNPQGLTRRALLFADLVNKREDTLLGRLFGPPGEGGVAWALKITQITDKYQVRAFLRRLAAMPNIALVGGCHGDVITHRCAEFLTEAAEEL